MMRAVRLFMSVPSYRGWSGHFGSSVTGMVHNLATNGLKCAKLEAFTFMPMLQASCLSQARQRMLSEAVKGGFTHWLCLADDMVYPHDFADRLLAHDLDIVAANYCRKKIGQVDGVFQGMDGKHLDSTGKTGLEEVAWIGLDSCMMNVAAINSIPAPHFEVRWVPDRNAYIDLDMFFSAKVREHGLKIWCDHDTSQLIQHIGEFPYMWPQKPREVKAEAKE